MIDEYIIILVMTHQSKQKNIREKRNNMLHLIYIHIYIYIITAWVFILNLFGWAWFPPKDFTVGLCELLSS